MTEGSGWPPVEQPAPVEPEPDESQADVPEPVDQTAEDPAAYAAQAPDEDANPQQVAEEAADAEPPELPDPEWLTEARNLAHGWELAFAEDVHRRLRNLEK